MKPRNNALFIKLVAGPCLLVGAILLGTAGAETQAAQAQGPKPTDAITRPDLGMGPPSGELDLPDALWPGLMERYWKDRTPESHIVFQRLLTESASPLPVRAHQSCRAWLAPRVSSPTVGDLLLAHLFLDAPGSAQNPSRVDYLCHPKSAPARWACRVDRFAKSDNKTPTATLHVELLADKLILQLDTLHCAAASGSEVGQL